MNNKVLNVFAVSSFVVLAFSSLYYSISVNEWDNLCSNGYGILNDLTDEEIQDYNVILHNKLICENVLLADNISQDEFLSFCTENENLFKVYNLRECEPMMQYINAFSNCDVAYDVRPYFDEFYPSICLSYILFKNDILTKILIDTPDSISLIDTHIEYIEDCLKYLRCRYIE